VQPEGAAMNVPEAIRELASGSSVGCKSEPVVVSMADVKAARVSWLWRNRVPLGMVSILDGDPDLGKSTLTLDLAARVSTGMDMPDGTSGVSGGVVLLSAEDDLAVTIKPKLDAAGADVDRVRAITAIKGDGGERLPELTADLEHIESVAIEIGAKLIVIDPLMAYLGENVNSYRDQDVRRALAPVAHLAARLGAAVLVVRHLNKLSGGSAIYRGGGSIGIIGAARAGLLLARDPEDDQKRILAVTKLNIGPKPSALSFEISTTEAGVPWIEWGGVSEHTADSLLATPGVRESDSKLNFAMDWLEDVLQSGRLRAKRVFRQASDAGISETTLKRAKKDLRVESVKGSFDSEWWWSLPPRDTEGATKGANSSHVGTLGTLGEKPNENGQMKDASVGTLGEECQGDQVVEVGTLGDSDAETTPELTGGMFD